MTSDAQRRAAADVLAQARAKVARVRLCLDGDLLDEHAQLEQALATARAYDEQHNEITAPEVARQVVELEERIADAEIEFVFRAMGRGRWRKLAADNPPSDDQAREGAEFDVDVFPFEAMAASLEDPEMTADELRQLHDDVLDEAQFVALWSACLRANLGGALNRPESAAARSVLEANARLKSVPPSDSAGLAAS